MRKEEENSEGKFPWLEDINERKYMTDREILDKYVNLDNSCLTKIEKTHSWALRIFVARGFCHGKGSWCVVAIGVEGQAYLLTLSTFSSFL